MSLKNKKFVNNFPGLFFETEEIKETIYGEGMLNENYNEKFDRPFLVGMSRTKNMDDEKSSSGFFITLRELDFLNKYVVVGEVFKGREFLGTLDPSKEIKIVNSGLEKEYAHL